VIPFEAFLLVSGVGVGAGLAVYQFHTIIHRLNRKISRLEDEIYDLHMDLSDKKKLGEPRTAVVVKSEATFKPVIVESVGPPCDPPESGEPYR
jgi:hypothetical protein